MAYISKITPLGSSESYDLKAAKLVTARSLKTKLDSTTAVTFDGSADQNAIPVTGTLGAANGGTGKTSLQDAANALINALSTGSSTPVDADYYVSQYVSGGTTTTTYHRRPMSALYSYIQGKADTRYVKKTGDTMTGILTNSTSIWAGIDANGNNVSSGECDIGTGGPSGKIYFYNTSGGRGIYGFNSSSAGAYILTVDSNNNVSLNGNAATATKATQDQNGYNLNDSYRKEFVSAIDLSSLNVNTWYPVVAILPASGFRRLSCVVHLNSGTVPSWSTHSAGFTAVVELLATAGGWGTTSARTILLQNNQGFISDTNNPPVGYTQFTNSSRACFYLRGGGKYFLKTDWIASWGIVTSSTTYSSQTIAPVTTYPNFSGVLVTLVDMNGYSSFTRAYGAVWNDYAEYRITKDTIKPGRCVIETGKDDLILSTERLQPGAEIVSDTFGFAIGETDKAKTPIATTGRVLAYIYEGREAALAAIGKPVCSGPDGTVSIMTDEEYQKYGYCAIGTISAVPDYEEWGTGKVKVNNRIWIRIR